MLFAGLAEHTGEDVEVFVGVLAGSGSAREAAEVVRKYVGEEGEGGVLREAEALRCWEAVMRGLEAEGDERVLVETWEDVRESHAAVTAGMMGPVVRFYCRGGEVRRARMWYERLVGGEGLVPELETHVEVLRLCAEKGETEWAQEVFAAVLNGGGGGGGGGGAGVSREAWDVVLQWADVITGDSNEISRLLTLMKERAATTGIHPTIETFNELIRFAISRGDYRSARKHHKLAIHRRFAPNRRTLELQIEYLVLAGKTKLAPPIYEQLRAEELPPSYPAHSVQLLLQALCREPSSPEITELITRIHTDLGEWNSPLQTATTTALLSRFLQSCQFSAVIALLNDPSCTALTAADRRKIIHEMGEHIGRPTTSLEAAWDTYQILYQVFPELSVRQRTDIMRLFFTLGRSDMATMVFKHMRGTPGRRPGPHSYVVALAGVAYSRDIDALKVVHNALKLDQAVEMDTRLANALMDAYNRCGVPLRAVQFWEDVKQSREGPDYQSISVVFEAYGNMFGGVQRAKILWGQLRSMGVRPTVGNYRAYIEALGKGGKFEEAFGLARGMEMRDGVRPDVKLLGTVYALTKSQDVRDKVAEWAGESYPAEWKEIEARVEQLPRDIMAHEALEALGGSRLQNLLQGSQTSMLAIEEGEKGIEEFNPPPPVREPWEE
ncbi:hypothetical protein P167DRAFT_516633 [Morchella conica CCBAS932]|uniref:Pentacotripeptide-repeat region of PRORP domain-containing protein n=1 Tax=Morchella conica CCBAS932 TaxID=1392247 RepID=A0A3N4L160_9PEZI|nr:hypothetical protein P167DRAFT_516633 [Morchella conica CCBAS932]